MTAKQKAAQLRYKYSTVLDLKTTDGLVLQCALIVVDEIINSIECVNSNEIELDVKYWNEVKKEIESIRMG